MKNWYLIKSSWCMNRSNALDGFYRGKCFYRLYSIVYWDYIEFRARYWQVGKLVGIRKWNTGMQYSVQWAKLNSDNDIEGCIMTVSPGSKGLVEGSYRVVSVSWSISILNRNFKHSTVYIWIKIIKFFVIDYVNQFFKWINNLSFFLSTFSSR